MNFISYLNGISIAFYFAVCLLCGLQLIGHIFGSYRYYNSIVSRLLGSVLLTWACGALLYMAYAITGKYIFAMLSGGIDVAAFAGMACMAYALYANRCPTFRTAFLLSLPYGLILLFMLFYPHLYNDAFIPVTVCLIGQFLYYFRASHRHERLLNDLYADPERHSTKWLITFVCMYAVYWVVRICFVYTSLSPWCDVALYFCMSVLILFVFTKVCTYGESVSSETLEQVEEATNETNENIENGETNAKLHTESNAKLPIAKPNNMPDRLTALMTDEQIYLRPDLTIEEVALRLNTNPKYLSNVINKEMHTTFSQWVNFYRIERAKELLLTTDDKVEYIGLVCGYNSRQVFIRAFTTRMGQSPSEWRKNKG